VPSDIEYVKSN